LTKPKLTLAFVAGALLLFGLQSFATDDIIIDEDAISDDQSHLAPAALNFSSFELFEKPRFVNAGLNPLEIYSRTQAVLKHFGVPDEPDFSNDLASLNGRQTWTGVQALASILDPDDQLTRFATATPQSVATFKDYDSKTMPDMHVALSPILHDDGPLKRFAATVHPNDPRPLKGLRIALDPGHMGGDTWDQRTGKYITDHKGHTLSEGVLNLQTSLLLKQRFEKLGATVLITHETLAPVEKNITWENLNIATFAKQKLREETLDHWFQSLLQVAPPGPALFSAFDMSKQVQHINAEIMRWEYFILRADLQARAKVIEQFHPHITLIIHYDVGPTAPKDSHGLSIKHFDAAKAYVPGSYIWNELSSREDRRNFLHHLTDPYAWEGSVALSQKIVQSLTRHLGVSRDSGIDSRALSNTVNLGPGVLARNLALNSKLFGVMSYVECLFYNDPIEFQKLIPHDFTMQIDSQTTYYSSRLVEVADALEKATVEFATTFR